jgi:hypothetical protein
MAEPLWTDLAGCVNLRDIGGCVTRTGEKLAAGQIYRGAQICGMEAVSVERLIEIAGIQRVVDLRTAGEIRDEGRAVLPGSAELHHLPFLPSIRPHWAVPVDRSPPATAGRYFEMVQVGMPALARIVELLGEAPLRPTLIHCVAGRDRTGIVVACLLDLLDVPEETIASDYALSFVVEDAEGGNARAENILLLLDRIRRAYGSVYDMLVPFEVSEQVVERLRIAMLSHREPAEDRTS